MKTRRWIFVLLLAGSVASIWPQTGEAQCCLDGLFAGCASCFRKAPPAYAVAPVMAPVAAPIPAPPPPVVVPVQQVSYVPETTYRTQYQCVPVTSYKPSCEIDPCTGCPRECMEQVTNYVQQAVNVPVTQYRAVYSTKYVQMQQQTPAYGMQGVAAPAYPGTAPAVSAPAASPFAAPMQTTPQAWGSAGNDIPQQIIQGQTSIAAPTLPQGMAQPGVVQQPMMPQQTFQQQIVPQGGTYATPSPSAVQPQPTSPPTLTPAPSLKPIPEMPRTMPGQNGAAAVTAPGTQAGGAVPSFKQPAAVPAQQAPALSPLQAPAFAPGSGTTPSGTVGPNGMPVVPGTGPGAATGAFPRLLEPTSHTTSWQPAAARPTSYPTAALPGRLQ
jgi:hypothetical protein